MKAWLRKTIGVENLEKLITKNFSQFNDTLANTDNKVTTNEEKINFTNKQLNDLFKKIGFILKKYQDPNIEKVSSSNNEVISEFKILNGEESISFESIDLEDFKKHFKELYVKEEDQEMLSNTLSSVVGASSNIAIASLATHGLYKATAPAEKLMSLNSGGYGSAVMGSGKISSQAGFLPVGATVFTPLVLFQIASIVTGQYYMNGINKQLKSVESKLDELIKLFHIERQAKLIKSFKFISEFIQRKNFVLEDFVSVKAIIHEIANVREDYFLLVEDAYTKIRSSNKYESLSSLKEARKINSDFEKTSLIFRLKNSLIADELYHLAKITEFHMNLCYKDSDINRINVINDQLDNMKNFETKNLCFYKTVELYHEIKKDTLKCFDKSLKETWVNEKEIKDIKLNFSKMLNDFEKEKHKKMESISTSYKKTIEPFSQKKTFCIDNRDGNPKLLVENF